MPFFTAVENAGICLVDDLVKEAKKLISQIGPYVEDQETLKLICLLQLLTPPTLWTEKVNCYYYKTVE